jgi:hypothetical protein
MCPWQHLLPPSTRPLPPRAVLPAFVVSVPKTGMRSITVRINSMLMGMYTRQDKMALKIGMMTITMFKVSSMLVGTYERLDEMVLKVNKKFGVTPLGKMPCLYLVPAIGVSPVTRCRPSLC